MIGWDDLTTQILSQEKTLQDFIYSYWYRFSFHLERSLEAIQYHHTWTAYQIATTYDKSLYKTLEFRKNNKFINRLAERAKHSRCDWTKFEANHRPQHEIFRRSTYYLNMFIYKYFLVPP